MKKRILLTGFLHTSSQRILENVTGHRIVMLPNDKIKDSQIVIDTISGERFDYIISIGQKPNIKNKVYIETTARDGEEEIITDFDCKKLVTLFEREGLSCKLSDHAGTSFCNQVYLKTLQHIEMDRLGSKMVFVHIPYEKNIEDLADFREKFISAVTGLREGYL